MLVNVRFVVTVAVQPFVAVTVIVELVILKVRVVLPLILNAKQDIANAPDEKVPAVNVGLPVIVNASAKVHPPPVPLNTIEHDNVLPLVVIVLPVVVDENVIVPEADQVVLATIVKLPRQLIVPELEKVNAPDPVQFSDKQFSAPVRVTVPVPEAALKKTSSVAVGTEAPEEPPEVADQLVVEEVFHVPVPPTQYLSAIRWLLQASLPLEQRQLGLNQRHYLQVKKGELL